MLSSYFSKRSHASLTTNLRSWWLSTWSIHILLLTDSTSDILKLLTLFGLSVHSYSCFSLFNDHLVINQTNIHPASTVCWALDWEWTRRMCKTDKLLTFIKLKNLVREIDFTCISSSLLVIICGLRSVV